MRNSSRRYKITMATSSSDELFNENDIIVINSGEEPLNTFEEITGRVVLPCSSQDPTLDDFLYPLDTETGFQDFEYFETTTNEISNTSSFKEKPKETASRESTDPCIESLIVPFFPIMPREVQANLSGMYEWVFNYEAEWGEAMIDAYLQAAFFNYFENKQLEYFNIGKSHTIFASEMVQPYREQSLVYLSESLVSSISEKWKPASVTDLVFKLYKEKNTMTQRKVVFMIEFCLKKIRMCIPYLKGVVEINVSPDKSIIKHTVTISTWLNFQNESVGWMRTPNVVYQRNIANQLYYGLDHLFKLFFTESNKIFEK